MNKGHSDPLRVFNSQQHLCRSDQPLVFHQITLNANDILTICTLNRTLSFFSSPPPAAAAPDVAATGIGLGAGVGSLGAAGWILILLQKHGCTVLLRVQLQDKTVRSATTA